jgi:hypothetical protein
VHSCAGAPLAVTDRRRTVRGRYLDQAARRCAAQVTRRDKGRQVHILTTVSTTQLPAPGVVYRMTGRCREENWFR